MSRIGSRFHFLDEKLIHALLTNGFKFSIWMTTTIHKHKMCMLKIKLLITFTLTVSAIIFLSFFAILFSYIQTRIHSHAHMHCYCFITFSYSIGYTQIAHLIAIRYCCCCCFFSFFFYSIWNFIFAHMQFLCLYLLNEDHANSIVKEKTGLHRALVGTRLYLFYFESSSILCSLQLHFSLGEFIF